MRRISIGAVTGVFGLKGDLRVHPLIGDDSLFKKIKKAVFVHKNGDETEVRILCAKRHKGEWLVKIEGTETPEASMAYKGCRLTVSDSFLPHAGSDEVYWIDIEGARVKDREGFSVGTLVGYIETGSHDVFKIEGDDGFEYMISNNPYHVLLIETENKTVTVDRTGLVASG
ncbi:MAG: ribosome maturation factor RimM [Deferribacteraceae bacterium]|jgi:16S rRNA processing protein RimM|nr:ribosome maturation factor RimM [Deferribacteraceae bacterium]